jgi:hypothetical protein
MDEQGYKDHITALEARRDALEKEVDALEEVVRGLEAEGLKPLVDRLRTQISSIRALVVAMATAIDELLETSNGKPVPAK